MRGIERSVSPLLPFHPSFLQTFVAGWLCFVVLFGNCAKKLLMFFFVDRFAPIALDILVVLVVVVVLVLVGCSCCSCFLIVLLSCCLVVLVVLVVLLFYPPTCVKRFFRDHQYIQIRPNLSTSVFFFLDGSC